MQIEYRSIFTANQKNKLEMNISKKYLAVLGLVGMIAFTSCDDTKKKEAEAQIEAEKMEAEQMQKEAEMKMEEEKMEKERMETSIAAKAMNTEDLSTLVTALKSAGLAQMMMDEGSYTVFAPSNNAFSKLPAGTVENLLKPENKEALTSLLQYHVVSGDISAEKLADAIKNANGTYEFKTVNGGTLSAKMDGEQIVIMDSRGKSSQVIEGNIPASNGRVHIVNNVLMQKK